MDTFCFGIHLSRSVDKFFITKIRLFLVQDGIYGKKLSPSLIAHFWLPKYYFYQVHKIKTTKYQQKISSCVIGFPGPSQCFCLVCKNITLECIQLQ